MEIWKKVFGYSAYEVSDLGNVKRKDKILKKEVVKGGYLRVTLSENNIQKRFQIHRLVAIIFLNNNEQKPCVNHKDGNVSNNRVENLEWCTYSENENHSYKILGKINHNRKLSNDKIVFIRSNFLFGMNGNIKILAEKYNVNVTTIYNIIKNKYYV
jgi:hypothetical protein